MKIVHISDTHISNKKVYEKVDTNKLFMNAIHHINKLIFNIDFVLISGDLVQDGTLDEYHILKNMLDLLKVPYYLLPGNHDDRANLKKVFSDINYYRDEKFCNFVLDEFPLKIIGLDSVTSNKVFGSLCKDRLNWLKKELIKEQNKPTLIFMHHPPISLGINAMDNINLKIGNKEFEEIIKDNSQIKAIGCGHIHRSSFTLWQNTTVISVPSTAYQTYLDLVSSNNALFMMQPVGIHIFYWNEEIGLNVHIDPIGQFEGPYEY